MERNFVTVNQANVTRKPLATNLLNNSKGAIVMRKRICSLIVVVALFFAMVQVAPVSAEETASTSSSAVEETEETKEDLTQRYDPNDYGVRTSTNSKGVTTIKFDGGKEKNTNKKNGAIYWDYIPLTKIYGDVETLKFFGIDSEQNVYLKLYGDGIIFFNKKNIFSAKTFLFSINPGNVNCETDKNGYLVNLIAYDEKISIYEDLSEYDITIKEDPCRTDWYIKRGSHKYYLYLKKFNMTGTVTWKKKKLYFNGKLIAKNITKKVTKERFGLYRSKIYFAKGKKIYCYNPKTKKKKLYSRTKRLYYWKNTIQIIEIR